MTIEFINSEICHIDGKEMIYFRDSISLLKQIEQTLSEIGPQKFFSSTDNKVKRVRESLAEFFFILALKKDTNKDWLLMQPKDDFPDFILMTVDNNPITITLDQFELVEIPSICQTYDQMMDIVNTKLNKGYPENYHLLIFVNHEKSKEWIALLSQQLENYHPFKAVWTVHLLFKGKDNLYSSVVNKIRPYPTKNIETSFNEVGLYQPRAVPTFMDKTEREGKTFLGFKPDFAKEFTKSLRKLKLKKHDFSDPSTSK